MEIQLDVAVNDLNTISPSFQLQHVTRKWGDKYALNNLNLNIKPGEIIALIGPSGGGKSTLLRILAGVLKPTEGSVLVNGKDLTHFPPSKLRNHRSKCRIVEQSHLLVPQSTVHQNVLSGELSQWGWARVIAGALWPIKKEKVHQLLDSLGIAEHQWKLANELSGGQMQRVAVARALISNPLAILADEPTASLDPSTARSVTETIMSQANARGISLVFCTHWLDGIMSQCDRIIGLRDGKLILDASPTEICREVLDILYEGSDERF